jgi:hypothetical protein
VSTSVLLSPWISSGTAGSVFSRVHAQVTSASAALCKRRAYPLQNEQTIIATNAIDMLLRVGASNSRAHASGVDRKSRATSYQTTAASLPRLITGHTARQTTDSGTGIRGELLFQEPAHWTTSDHISAATSRPSRSIILAPPRPPPTRSTNQAALPSHVHRLPNRSREHQHHVPRSPPPLPDAIEPTWVS